MLASARTARSRTWAAWVRSFASASVSAYCRQTEAISRRACSSRGARVRMPSRASSAAGQSARVMATSASRHRGSTRCVTVSVGVASGFGVGSVSAMTRAASAKTFCRTTKMPTASATMHSTVRVGATNGRRRCQGSAGRRSPMRRSAARPANTHCQAPRKAARTAWPADVPAVRPRPRRAAISLPLGRRGNRGAGRPARGARPERVREPVASAAQRSASAIRALVGNRMRASSRYRRASSRDSATQANHSQACSCSGFCWIMRRKMARASSRRS